MTSSLGTHESKTLLRVFSTGAASAYTNAARASKANYDLIVFFNYDFSQTENK